MCDSGFSKSMPSASFPSSPSSPISTSPTAAALEITPSIVSPEPASSSAPTSILQIGPTTLLEGFVPSDEQKRIYRFQGVELIASNNIFAFPDPIIDPRTQYPTERVTDICDNEEFAQCWKENLAPPIVQYLANLVDSWTLNVVRSGFADTEHRPRNPLVVLLSTRLSSTDRCVTEELALDIVRVIAGIISSHWHGESIYVDVCSIQGCSTSARSTSFKRLSDIPSRYYNRNPQLPGCSVGTENQAGTLTGYIKHGNDFYRCTSLHVGGPPGTQIYAPALWEHNAIKEALEKFYPSLLTGSFLHRIHTRFVGFISGPYNYVGQWRKTLEACLAWNPDCGTVTFSSDSNQLLIKEGYDWCLTKFPGKPGKNYNRHVPFHQLDPSSGFQFESVPYFSISDVAIARDYFASGPSFKPIRSNALQALDVCLKPPSRTTKDWTVGRVNTINMVTKGSAGGLPHEYYSIVSTSPEKTAAFSAKGDSGSVILDYNFQPAAVIQDGTCATSASQDITGAVHLGSILTDMENTNGWKQGSVVFCSDGD